MPSIISFGFLNTYLNENLWLFVNARWIGKKLYVLARKSYVMDYKFFDEIFQD